MILVGYFHRTAFGFSFSAGSFFISGGGQLYMWGKLKNTGDDWMYPKPLMDLRLYTCTLFHGLNDNSWL